MQTLPSNKLSPPFRSSGAAMMEAKIDSHGNVRRDAEVRLRALSGKAEKTFFKGATSFVLQAQGSTKIAKNDQTLRDCLGLDNRSKAEREQMASITSVGKPSGATLTTKHEKSQAFEIAPLDPRSFA